MSIYTSRYGRVFVDAQGMVAVGSRKETLVLLTACVIRHWQAITRKTVNHITLSLQGVINWIMGTLALSDAWAQRNSDTLCQDSCILKSLLLGVCSGSQQALRLPIREPKVKVRLMPFRAVNNAE